MITLYYFMKNIILVKLSGNADLFYCPFKRVNRLTEIDQILYQMKYSIT